MSLGHASRREHLGRPCERSPHCWTHDGQIARACQAPSEQILAAWPTTPTAAHPHDTRRPSLHDRLRRWSRLRLAIHAPAEPFIVSLGFGVDCSLGQAEQSVTQRSPKLLHRYRNMTTVSKSLFADPLDAGVRSRPRGQERGSVPETAPARAAAERPICRAQRGTRQAVLTLMALVLVLAAHGPAIPAVDDRLAHIPRTPAPGLARILAFNFTNEGARAR